MKWAVTSFYRFLSLDAEQIARHRQEVGDWLAANEFVGLVILAPEGINGTVAGPVDLIADFKTHLTQSIRGLDGISFKDSTCPQAPFRGLRVEIRSEIVGMKRPDIVPLEPENGHLSPREWHELLDSGRPVTLIDTRNQYETRLGLFRGARDPGLDHFSHWPEYAERAEIPRDRPVMIYCTGGIRCEKVALDLRSRGFEKVYQLRDGILGYLAEYPDGYFEGECFVFDDRVAVDSDLQPTAKYGICPACGEPAESRAPCGWCEGPSFICPSCEPEWSSACSKTCRDRIQRHGTKANPLNVLTV
jgi:UPF0176 protein